MSTKTYLDTIVEEEFYRWSAERQREWPTARAITVAMDRIAERSFRHGVERGSGPYCAHVHEPECLTAPVPAWVSFVQPAPEKKKGEKKPLAAFTRYNTVPAGLLCWDERKGERRKGPNDRRDRPCPAHNRRSGKDRRGKP